MNIKGIDAIPETLHDKTRNAVAAAFGAAPVAVVAPVTGGASGALAFRINTAERDYLLRLEGPRSPLRNPHQNTCMRIAAEAGIAPPVRHIDDANGVVIIDFVQQKPLSAFPGGPAALAGALGTLGRRLQDTEPFPVLGDYRAIIDRMIGRLRTLYAPGLIDVHAEGFSRIRNVCPWDAAAHVSTHNDPNQRNILFDGERLWLIDWEASYRNDKLVDIAIMADNLATTPELETPLLRAWLGAEPDAATRSRLVLVRLMTRMYYACLLSFLSLKPDTPSQDLSAPTPEQFKAMLMSGQMKQAETMLTLAKMLLASFKVGVESAEVQRVMATFG